MTVDDFINDLDQFGQDLSLMNIDSVWAQGAERVVTAVNAETGTSAKFKYVMTPDSITFVVEDYVIYQNYGVHGAKSAYMGIRNSEVDNRYYSYDSSNPNKRPYHKIFMNAYGLTEGQAYGASNKVYTYGLRPKNWFSIEDGPGIVMQTRFVQEVEDYIENLL